MSSDTLTMEELGPAHPIVREATFRALGCKLEPSEIQKFLDKAASPQTPSPIGATANVDIAIWGKCKCDPDGQPWRYDNSIWGGPAYFGSSIGFMYTAYDSWDAFFQNTSSCHVQGIASGGGILQINWFNRDSVPVGQFNGAAGGVGLLEAGGSGGWTRK